MATLEKADFIPAADLRGWQDGLWKRQGPWIADSPLYRRLWGSRAAPVALDGLAEVPLSDKSMLRASQRAASQNSSGMPDASVANSTLVAGLRLSDSRQMAASPVATSSARLTSAPS